jgi:excinuclease UvrABC nuclease subunit
MPEEKSKTVNFDSESIKKLPNNKPVVYEIFNKQGKNIYTGSAKRSRVQGRIIEHLSDGKDHIPGGVKVKIQQKKTISEAERSEKRITARSKPKYNKKGKPSK